jgi:maleylacetoacetate isomerase
VRIALNLKGLAYESAPVHLANSEQQLPEFREVNPQELIPVLRHGNRVIQQSLAIMEYLDETFPEQPLLPAYARDRARARAIAQMVACDIHPLGNLRIQRYLEHELGANQDQRETWTRHWIGKGFQAIEQVLADSPSTGSFCEGDIPTIADCCLIPQIYNARRVGVDVSAYPFISRIDENCQSLEAFKAAHPQAQPDAPPG